MEVLQPLATNDGRHTEEPVAPHSEQAQARVDSVAPTMEQPMVAEPTAPTMEEPSTTGPTSPGGRLHDEGNPSVEEALDAMARLSGLARAGMKPAGDASSSAAQGPPMVAKPASSTAVSMVGVVLRRSVQAR